MWWSQCWTSVCAGQVGIVGIQHAIYQVTQITLLKRIQSLQMRFVNQQLHSEDRRGFFCCGRELAGTNPVYLLYSS